MRRVTTATAQRFVQVKFGFVSVAALLCLSGPIRLAAQPPAPENPPPAGQPSTPAPEGQPSTPAPAGEPSTPTPAGQPATTTPAGQPSTPAPGSPGTIALPMVSVQG